MATWVDLVGNFKQMDLKSVGAYSVEASGREMIELNRMQMIEGKGSSRNIGRYRSAAYSRFKNELSSVAGLGNVDLRLTGSFQSKMTLSVSGTTYEIDSTDGKTEALVEKYGGQIFGLNPKNEETYTDRYLAPEFQKVVERLTGLKYN